MAIRSIATGPHVETEVLYPRIHRKRPVDRAGRRDSASDRYRRPGLRPVLQFWQFRWTAATATPRRRWLVRRRLFRTIPTANTGAASAEASGAPADAGGFFEGAAAREARDRAGAQPAGARRCDGRLARLRARGRLFRTAGNGRDPQAQDRLRPDQIPTQGRSG